MNNMNWMAIAVLAIILIGILVGLVRGGLRIAVSLVVTVLTLVIVCFVSPYVTDAIIALTPADEIMESYCEKIISNAMGGSGTKVNLTEEQVRSILRGAGVSEEELAAVGITVEDIVNGEVDGEDLEQFGISPDILNGHIAEKTESATIFSADLPREMQIAAIEHSVLPDIFKDLLLSNNNNKVYEKLGATNFGEYIGKYFSRLFIGICSFFLTFVVATLVIRAIVFALDIITTLPGLGLINRLVGMALGGGIALIVIDVIFVAITLLYMSTYAGMMLDMIAQSEFLTFLYDNNIVMDLMMKIW